MCSEMTSHEKKINHVILRLTEILSDRNKLNLGVLGGARIAMQMTYYDSYISTVLQDSSILLLFCFFVWFGVWYYCSVLGQGDCKGRGQIKGRGR